MIMVYTQNNKFRIAINFVIGFMAFAFAFPFLFNQSRVFYYTHIDKTEYYTIEQPVPVSKDVYESCEKLEMHITRTSQRDFTFLAQYRLIRIENNNKQLLDTPFRGVATKGTSEVNPSVDLPCDIELGTYYIEGIFDLYIFDNVTKTYIWRTEIFEVM